MRIALAGKMGAGKTEFAKVLVEKYGFKKLSFAHKVREVAVDLFGLPYEEAFGEKKNREVLQMVGSGMRTIVPTVWIDYLARQLDTLGPDDNVVIDDVRYKNEFDILKQRGFIMIRIEADEMIRRNRIPNTFTGVDALSETDLDGIPPEPFSKGNEPRVWDALLANNSTIERLYSNVDAVYEYYNKR